jgi:integrase
MMVRIKGVKRVRSRGRVYYYDRVSGKRIKASPDTPQFFTEVDELRRAVKPRAVPRPGSLGGLIEEYRASPEFAALAPRTRADYQKVFDYLQKIAAMPVHQIDEAAVLTFRDRAFRQRKRRFANYLVQVLRLLFKWGRPRQITPHLLTDVPLIRRPRSAAKANRAWTDKECAAVLGAATGGVKVGIALGMYGALREGDMLRFSWSDYDGSAIQWTQGKTGDPVWLPAHRDLRALLDEAQSTRTSVQVVTNQSGQPYTGDGFRTQFFRLIKRLEAAGKVGPGLTFHGLRHTAGKVLDELGCDTRTIAAVLRQRSEAMARHYSEEGDRRRRVVVAIKKLEQRTEQKTVE